MSEARELNHSYVGTEHLLLGLIREEKGVAAQALKQAGMSIESARVETLRVLLGAGGHRSRRHTRISSVRPWSGILSGCARSWPTRTTSRPSEARRRWHPRTR